VGVDSASSKVLCLVSCHLFPTSTPAWLDKLQSWLSPLHILPSCRIIQMLPGNIRNNRAPEHTPGQTSMLIQCMTSFLEPHEWRPLASSFEILKLFGSSLLSSWFRSQFLFAYPKTIVAVPPSSTFSSKNTPQHDVMLSFCLLRSRSRHKISCPVWCHTTAATTAPGNSGKYSYLLVSLRERHRRRVLISPKNATGAPH